MVVRRIQQNNKNSVECLTHAKLNMRDLTASLNKGVVQKRHMDSMICVGGILCKTTSCAKVILASEIIVILSFHMGIISVYSFGVGDMLTFL